MTARTSLHEIAIHAFTQLYKVGGGGGVDQGDSGANISNDGGGGETDPGAESPEVIAFGATTELLQ